jgi:CopG family nickel-responsive transcriptional regulator
LVVISISIPDELLQEVDKLVEGGFHSNRSEAIRYAIEDSVAGLELDPQIFVEAVVAIIYKREDSRVESRLAAIRHDYDNLIVEALHRHFERSCTCGEVSSSYCFELLIAEGKVAEILEMIGKVRGVRGVQQVRHGFVPIADPVHSKDVER